MSLLAPAAEACTVESCERGAAELGGASALHGEIIAKVSQRPCDCNDSGRSHAVFQTAHLRGMGGMGAMDDEEVAGVVGSSGA